jgi:hypothetical protein
VKIEREVRSSPDIDARVEAAAAPGFKTVADVLVTTCRRVVDSGP